MQFFRVFSPPFQAAAHGWGKVDPVSRFFPRFGFAVVVWRRVAGAFVNPPQWKNGRIIGVDVLIEHHPGPKYRGYHLQYLKVMFKIPNSWDIYQTLNHGTGQYLFRPDLRIDGLDLGIISWE